MEIRVWVVPSGTYIRNKIVTSGLQGELSVQKNAAVQCRAHTKDADGNAVFPGSAGDFRQNRRLQQLQPGTGRVSPPLHLERQKRASDPLTHQSARGPTQLTGLDAAHHRDAFRLPVLRGATRKDLRLVGLQPPLVVSSSNDSLTVKSCSRFAIVRPETKQDIIRKRAVSCVRCECVRERT